MTGSKYVWHQDCRVQAPRAHQAPQVQLQGTVTSPGALGAHVLPMLRPWSSHPTSTGVATSKLNAPRMLHCDSSNGCRGPSSPVTVTQSCMKVHTLPSLQASNTRLLNANTIMWKENIPSLKKTKTKKRLQILHHYSPEPARGVHTLWQSGQCLYQPFKENANSMGMRFRTSIA